MNEKLKRLFEERRKKYEEIKSFKSRVDAENRDFNAEEEQSWQRMNTDFDKIEKQIEVEQRMDAMSRREEEARQPANQPLQPASGTNIEDEQNRRHAFSAYLRGQASSEQRLLLRTVPQDRAVMQVDNSVTGGMFASPQTVLNEMLAAAPADITLYQYARALTCQYGESIGCPVLTGRVSKFKRAGELTKTETEDGLTFAKRELKPIALQRKTIPISAALVQSSSIDIVALIIEQVNIALGETKEEEFMIGDGATQALGLYTPSDLGIPTTRDVLTSAATGFGSTDDLVDIVDNLKQKYQKNARWLFHRKAISLIRKLKDGIGQMIWQPGLQLSEPMRILNFPYITSDYNPCIFTANKYIGIFGDFRYYWIADALSMAVKILDDSKYAEEGLIGYMFDRLAFGGMPVMDEAFVRIKTKA